MDEVILNKAAVIERCVQRVREEHAGDDRNITDNQTKQDAIVLNILRSCEAAIDLGMHLVRRFRLGVPQDSREAFDLLTAGGQLPAHLTEPLKRMVGFRNIAVHDYQKVSLAIVQAIVERHLAALLELSQLAVRSWG
jgi:uncharacterized protein YutE (UPF0331/DUF86 family)